MRDEFNEKGMIEVRLQDGTTRSLEIDRIIFFDEYELDSNLTIVEIFGEHGKERLIIQEKEINFDKRLQGEPSEALKKEWQEKILRERSEQLRQTYLLREKEFIKDFCKKQSDHKKEMDGLDKKIESVQNSLNAPEARILQSMRGRMASTLYDKVNRPAFERHEEKSWQKMRDKIMLYVAAVGFHSILEENKKAQRQKSQLDKERDRQLEAHAREKGIRASQYEREKSVLTMHMRNPNMSQQDRDALDKLAKEYREGHRAPNFSYIERPASERREREQEMQRLRQEEMERESGLRRSRGWSMSR